MATDGSEAINRIDLQVTEVHKALLSVAKMVDAGQRVVFDPDGSFVEDTLTGERIPMTRKDGVYELKLWAKQYSPSSSEPSAQDSSGQGFTRPR